MASSSRSEPKPGSRALPDRRWPRRAQGAELCRRRQRDLPAAQRTRYRGALRDWQITDPETNEPVCLRVAYIHSSEQAREVAAARERALTKAETALARVQRGLGGRYYKTRRQVDNKVAKILTGQAEGLIAVKTATRAGRPTLTYCRDYDAIATTARTDGIYALATNPPDA